LWTILQSAASDLSLLEAALHEAGALVRELMTKPLERRSKGAAGPVTNVDLAVDALLAERLLGARPDYGWLSEETPDEPARRLGKARVFMLDPIDGTQALVDRIPQFTISVGVVEGERAVAGAIYNPMTDEMFLGAVGCGATFNGRPARVSDRETLEGARMIAQASRFAAKKWQTPWPKMEIIERHSIAYRLALVAAGLGDAALLFGFKHEWDIAAGAAIVEAAGGVVSDLWGEPLRFNQEIPRAPGVAASGAALHALLIERTRRFPDPRATAEPT
jgi:myo-inositol-1(or 4)-monophosphatase